MTIETRYGEEIIKCKRCGIRYIAHPHSPKAMKKYFGMVDLK